MVKIMTSWSVMSNGLLAMASSWALPKTEVVSRQLCTTSNTSYYLHNSWDNTAIPYFRQSIQARSLEPAQFRQSSYPTRTKKVP